VKYEGSGSPKSCHDFRNPGTFLCPETTEHSAIKIAAWLQKSQHDFDSIRSKISFSKSAFSTILDSSKVQNQTQTHPNHLTNVI